MASGKISNKTTLSGSISSGNNLTTAAITGGSGTTDHSRLINKEKADQHPIEAITGLAGELAAKLNSETAMPLIENALKNKACGLYFDAMKELARKSYWYLTAEIDPKTGLGTKDSIISGPYDLGMGGGSGGGGGGVTNVSVKQLNWPSAAAVGTTGTETKIAISWSSTVGEANEPTGAGTIYLIINGKQVEIRPKQAQGTHEFEISKYLISGENSIQIKVLDMYGTTGTTIGVINGVSLELKSTFNQDTAFYGKVDFTYTPVGNVTKRVYFIIDEDVENARSEIVKSSNELQTYTIYGLSHGSHTLRVYFEAEVGATLVSSNTLFYDIIFVEENNSTPIIASEFNTFTQEQYISFSIPYRAFIDKKSLANIVLKVNDEPVRKVEVTTNGTHIWAYRSDIATLRTTKDESGNESIVRLNDPLVLEISCGSVVKRFEVDIMESKITVTPVLNNLELALSAIGRSNDDFENIREVWSFTTTPPPGSIEEPVTYTCTFKDFNWKSDGWVIDKVDTDGTPLPGSSTVLRVGGDARVVIPYASFAKNFTTSGKTIELEIATRSIRNYDTAIISCLDQEKSPFYTVEPLFEQEETRLNGYDISYNYTILEKTITTLGKHLFTYDGVGWVLDDAKVNLNDYGITLTETLLNAEGEDVGTVIKGDRILVNYSMEARGFEITPQVASIRSQQSFLSTQYKEDEHVRISFVIEPNTSEKNRIIWMYINGIASGAMQYPADDTFEQKVPSFITIGSSEAVVDIYNIRVYNSDLTNRQIVNNWIADTADAADKASRFNHNNILTEQDQLTPESLFTGAPDLPYIIWDIDPLPQSKNDVRPGNARYVDPTDSTRNFTAKDAEFKVQGTSSAVYPTKNIRLRTKKGKGGPNLEWYDDDGNDLIIKNGGKGFPITYPGGIGVDYFTFKVDYASSEGANNVELTKLYNDASKKYGLLTPPQQHQPTDSGISPEQVRVGIDGFPVAAFQQNAEGEISFCTKANFNNDKGNEDVYGFAEGDESWETTNNSAAETKYQAPVTEENFERGFEIRYPDSDDWSGDLSKLSAMTAWVYSTYREMATDEAFKTPVTFTYEEATPAEGGDFSTSTVTKTFTHDTAEYRLAKFKTELKDWFNVDSCLFYYLFTELFLMIDSRAKNAFPTYFATRTNELVVDADGNSIPNTYTDGGNRWYWIPYDMDTAIGIDNKGKLTFDYYLEDVDKLDGADVYNGQSSVMWCNIRDAFGPELAACYMQLRNQGLIDYDEVERRFTEHQSKWPEVLLNLDAHNKYIIPLKKGDNYLEMLQGTKEQQRKWWLYNRFKYIDSKYNAGDAKADFIQFRAYVDIGEEKPNLTLIPYANIYATASFGNGSKYTVSKRVIDRGSPIILENPFGVADDENDQETYIYSASQLKSIGDISGFHPDTVKVGNAIRLQELKVGDNGDKYPGYKNPYLKELTVGANTLLRTLDARNCINLGTGTTVAPDLSKCTNIEEIYFTGTKIKGIKLPDGGTIKKLHLPGTLKSLTILNQPLLEDLQIENTNTTITRSVSKENGFNLSGLVVQKDGWNDLNSNANIYLADLDAAVTKTIRVNIADKALYDAIIENESSLAVSCNFIDVRFDLVDATTIELTEYSTRLITKAKLTTDLPNINQLLNEVDALVDHPPLEEFKVSLIETLWLENIPSKAIQAKEFIRNMKAGTQVSLMGINETYNSWEEINEFYNLLDRHRGIDKTDSGRIPEKPQVTGVINLPSISYKHYTELLARYPEIIINARQIVSTVEFYNEAQQVATITLKLKTHLDESNEFHIIGHPIHAPLNPTKPPIQSHYYVFENWQAKAAIYTLTDGWSYDSAGEQWTEDLLLYGDTRIEAVYSEHLQEYTITFDPNSTEITVDPTSITTTYGSLITPPNVLGVPEGVRLDGWYFSNGVEWDFANSKVVADFVLTAKWVDSSVPSLTVTRHAYNAFAYDVKDTLGVVGWAVIKKPIDPSLPPVTWETIPATTHLTGIYDELDEAGDYYFWILDAGENEQGIQHTAKAKIVAYNIEVSPGIGIESYNFTENQNTFETTFATANTELQLNVVLDNHYENLLINGIANPTNTFDFVITSDCRFDLSCSPKDYTVSFDLQGKGTAIDPQLITYQHFVTRPLSQYWRESNEILKGWSLDREGDQLWDFEAMGVDRDITLYAVWEHLEMPTTVTLYIPEDTPLSPSGSYEVTFSVRNSAVGLSITTADYVRINYGDDDNYYSAVNGTFTHGYRTPGQKIVTIYGNNKGYTLGKSFDIPLVSPSKYVTNVELAWNLATITEGAFRDSSLTHVPLTEYITTIDQFAFAGCNQLEEFKPIGGALTEIKSSAFTGCSKLKTIDFNQSKVTTLGEYTFSSCSQLEELDLPATIEFLGTGCFAGCSILSKVILRNEQLQVNGYVFNSCSNLQSAGPLNSGMDIEYAWQTVIPDYAFMMGSNQTQLRTIILPSTLEQIGKYAFQNTKLKAITHSGITEPAEGTLVLPESLKAIGQYAFNGCRTLLSVVIPPTVASIGIRAFSGCAGLQSAILYLTNSTEKATEAGQGWFYGAGSLNNLVIKIPANIFDADNGILPSEYFGDYWNEYDPGRFHTFGPIE